MQAQPTHQLAVEPPCEPRTFFHLVGLILMVHGYQRGPVRRHAHAQRACVGSGGCRVRRMLTRRHVVPFYRSGQKVSPEAMPLFRKLQVAF